MTRFAAIGSQRAIWLSAVIAGALVRGWRLIEQIPVDDEWHTLDKVLTSGYLEIAGQVGEGAYSIPIALYLRLAADTVGLSEVILRAPSLIGGIAMLALCPWAVRRYLGSAAAVSFAWLLALSPLLVFYSRFTRPYGITAMMTFLAVAAAQRWWTGGDARSALAYGACGVAATYLHLSALPFALAPLVFFVSRAAFGGWDELRSAVRRCLLVAVPMGLTIAALLGPGLLHDAQPVLSKLGESDVEITAVGRAALFFVGTRNLALAAAFSALALWGVVLSWRRAPGWTALVGAAMALQFLALLVASPFGAGSALVLARYLLPLLPPILMFTGAGLVGTARVVGLRGGRAQALVGLAGAALLASYSPLPEALFETRHWFPAVMMRGLSGHAPQVGAVPGFYRSLAAEAPGSLTLAEAPWYFSLHDNPLPIYERVHRQRTRIGFSLGLCASRRGGEMPASVRGMRWRSFVHLKNVEEVKQRGIDYVVFHTDLRSELSRVVDRVFVDWMERQPVDVASCIEIYRQRFGPPVYDDGRLVVFGLTASEKVPD